jgi:hypothetical protein
MNFETASSHWGFSDKQIHGRGSGERNYIQLRY